MVVTWIALLLTILCGLVMPAGVAPALAAMVTTPVSYRCDDEPLTALLVRGAVDDLSIPDPSSAPVPVGGFVVLQWRELRLQLPRTNNAGPASFTDGKWWWSLEDPSHPRFLLRRGSGEPERISCELAG